MSTVPVMSYAYQTQYAQKAAQQEKIKMPPAMEAFEGEKEALKKIYDNYMQNIGGYQNINGQMVHVTTVLHTDKQAQLFLMAVENRLRDLGALPPLPRPQQIWSNPAPTPYIY